MITRTDPVINIRPKILVFDGKDTNLFSILQIYYLVK